MSFARKTPYEKKYSRKNKEQEEWVMEKNALDSSAEQVDDLNMIMEQLEAKSEEGRRCALRNLIRTTRNLTCKEEDLEKHQKLLIQYLLQCMRGPPSVALLAFDAAEVLAVVYGDAEFFEGVLKAVTTIALTAAPQTLEEEQQQVVGAAVRTLGSICFFCCDDNDTTVDIIHDIDKIICTEPKNVSQPVVAAALGAWELIHTTTDFDDDYHERMTAAIWKHLKSSKSNVDTRMAAGRALALSFSRVADEGDTILNHRDWLAESERLTDVINECAFGSSRPKQDRNKEQALFKDLAAWMLEGEELPGVSITINGTKIVFETWKILARLANVRRILGSGLQKQLMTNSLVADVLQFTVPEKERRRRKTEADKKFARRMATLADKAKSARKARPLTTDDDDD